MGILDRFINQGTDPIFGGGLYDWSDTAAAGWNYLTDADYRARANQNVADRRDQGFSYIGSLMPQTGVRSAQAAGRLTGQPSNVRQPTISQDNVRDPRVQGAETPQDGGGPVGDYMGGGGGGGEPAPPAFAPTWFQGQRYSAADPLTRAMENYYQRQANQTREGLREDYLSNIQDLDRTRGEYQEMFPQALERGMVNLARYYGAISPHAVQSSQMVNEDALSDRVSSEEEKAMSSLDRALSKAGSQWKRTQSDIRDWTRSKQDEINNQIEQYEGQRINPAKIKAGYSPVVSDWDQASSIGRISDIYKAVPGRGRAPGVQSLRGLLGQGEEDEPMPEGEVSNLAKFLY